MSARTSRPGAICDDEEKKRSKKSKNPAAGLAAITAATATATEAMKIRNLRTVTTIPKAAAPAAAATQVAARIGRPRGITVVARHLVAAVRAAMMSMEGLTT